MLARSPSMQNRVAMYNDNALKIGLFGANCSSGRSATTVPERWSASWEDCLAVSKIADEAGVDTADCVQESFQNAPEPAYDLGEGRQRPPPSGILWCCAR